MKFQGTTGPGNKRTELSQSRPGIPHHRHHQEGRRGFGCLGVDEGPRVGRSSDTDGLVIPSPTFPFVLAQPCCRFINDTYRSCLCLLHPPHIITIAALYLTLIFYASALDTVLPQISLGDSSSLAHGRTAPPQPRRSTRQANQAANAEPAKKTQDPIIFLSKLNVSLPLIATVAQEIISLYVLWDRYKEDLTPKDNRRIPLLLVAVLV